jgi:hypothetical protein
MVTGDGITPPSEGGFVQGSLKILCLMFLLVATLRVATLPTGEISS